MGRTYIKQEPIWDEEYFGDLRLLSFLLYLSIRLRVTFPSKPVASKLFRACAQPVIIDLCSSLSEENNMRPGMH